MSAVASIYPPSPPNRPRDLTSPTARYRLQVIVVLVSLLLFVLLYVGLVVGSAWLLYWAVTFSVPRVDKGTIAVKIGLIGGSCLLFLFLLKGLFKRHKEDRSLRVEITEEEQPTLFAFIRRLCEETKAPFPRRVFLTPEVNAAVFYNTSILSLFLPTRKNLLIGLGLVNVLNLTEFKAVLAHEFGHFSQSSMKLGSYVYTSNRIIADMVFGRDWLDDLLRQLRGSDIRIAAFAWTFTGMLWVLRKILEGIFRAINFANSALSRQMEFNADLVAVSVTGSDALICGLSRLDFANDCLMQACQDLSAAGDHGLYTCDLFYHQNHAASYLRLVRKESQLGEPPPLPEDPSQTIEVFKPGDTGVPLMWATHPSNYDRERNAKRRYIRGAMDERSPWILFRDAQATREKVTWRYYRVVLKLKKDVVLAEPEAVQAFIDDEHGETTYNERYHGLYDSRYLEPGDISELMPLSRLPGEEAHGLDQLHAQLYAEGLKARMEDYTRRQQEHYLLSGLKEGELTLKGKDFEFRGQRYLASDAKKLLKRVDKELEEDRQWLATLDRKVFWVHYQMGRELGSELCREYEDRYRFHLGVQAILSTVTEYQSRLGSALQYLASKRELSREEFAQALSLFRQAHGALSRSLEDADRLILPQLKNMQAGTPLGSFLMAKDLIHGISSSQQALDGAWINKFMQQLGEVCDKVRRIHFKSLGGILALQEKITEKWSAQMAALPEVQAADTEPSERA